MKYLRIILLISMSMFACTTAGAQKNTRQNRIPEPPVISPIRAYKCFPQHHFPIAERLKRYPFNEAVKIAIVSFKTTGSVLLPVDSMQQTGYCYEYTSVLDGKDTSTRSTIAERFVLNHDQLDKLTAVLYNYDYRKISATPLPVSMSGCYAPHNAILFYNEKDEIFAFIELCFTCEDMRESDEKVDSGVPCLGKINLLKSFFKNNEIAIGTTKIPMIRMPDMNFLNSK